MKWYVLLKAWGKYAVGEKIELVETDAKSLVDAGYLKLAEPETEDSTKKAIGAAVAEFQKGIQTVVGEQIALAIKGMKVDGKQISVEVGKNLADDDPMALQNSLGTFAKAVQSFNTGHGMSKELEAYVQKAPSGMNEAVGEEGGILIPDQISAGIWQRAVAANDLLGRIQLIPITGNSYTVVQEAGDTMAAGTRNAGVRGYWVEEAGQITKSQPKFRRQALRLKKLGVLVYVTDEQLEDSPQSLEAFITDKAGREIAFMTGDALMNGDGIGKPLGVLNSACLISVTKETDQDATSIYAENIINMFSRLHAPSLANAAFFINQDTLPMLMSLTLAAGAGGVPLMWPAGGFNQAPANTILGKSVIPTEWNPTLGSAGDILLADWSQYMGISKGGVKSAVSIHLRFDYDETAFRFTYRMDGRPVWPAALTPYKSTVTQAPFVQIAVRA